MILELPESQSASLQFGITVRAWSLVFAADAFVSSKYSLKAINLIVLRCRRGNLRIHSSHISRSRHPGDREELDLCKSGIAAIPLELLLSFREAIVESALYDAEKKHLNYVKAAHDKHSGSHDGPPSNQVLRGGIHRQLCSMCTRVAPRIDYKAINSLLSKYSLSIVSSSIPTPLLMSPPYSSTEPHPWVIALPTHHSRPLPHSSKPFPVHTPRQGLDPHNIEISFFSPSFMRITSSDIMRFRNLVRTWHLAVVELSGTVTGRGSSAVGQSRCSSNPVNIPGAMVNMVAMDMVQCLPTMGHCEPRWMLLNSKMHAG